MRVAEHCFTATLRRGGSVSMVIDVPRTFEPHKTPVVVLAHGAGAGMRSDFMEYYATELSERGLGVVRFQFPYMERSSGGRRPPDRMDVLLETYQEADGSVALPEVLHPYVGCPRLTPPS